MKPRFRSILLLSITLLIGMVLGALLHAQMRNDRLRFLNHMHTEEGFVQSFLETIQPRDDAQAEKVRPILEETAAQVISLIHSNREEIRKQFVQMRERLDPLLDNEQRARMEERSDRWRGKERAKPAPHE